MFLKILNLLYKKKNTQKIDVTLDEIELHLNTSQTWGTDKKVYCLFYENLKLRTAVLDFQEILCKLPKKLSKLAFYYLVTQYWYYYSGLYPDEDYKNSFFYFLIEKDIKQSQIYHPRTQKIAYFYLNKIRLIN